MPAVLIACPFAEDLVPTRIDAASVDELDEENVLVDCPECGQDHQWTPLQAVISVAAP
jgi:hypothetical protein